MGASFTRLQDSSNESVSHMYDSIDKLKIAQEYVRLGFKVFPVHTIDNGICSCGTVDCKDIAKHPITEHGVKDATDNADELQNYFSGDYAIANIGLAAGEPSGVFVLDVDDLDDLAKLENANKPLPRTWTVETGSGKRHLYFRFDERCQTLKNSAKQFAGSLDVRTTGGYTILPPSVHKSGKRYQWLIPPEACEVASAPDWLLAIMPKHGDVAVKGDELRVRSAATMPQRVELYLEQATPAVSGERGHKRTFEVVCRLVELFGSLDDDTLIAAMQTWNARCEPPWTEKELRHKLSDARKRVNVQANESETEIDWPTIDAKAFYGIAGEIITAIEPNTECDPIALLLTLLTTFSCAVGRQPYFMVEANRQHANLFTAIVGSSSRGRKGTSLERIWSLFRDDNEFKSKRISGLSSGEGLIHAVRDVPIEASNGKFNVGSGIIDKRLFVVEPEFARTLKTIQRETNTLSAIMRDAWDSGTLRTMTKNDPLHATDAHIVLLTHITRDELSKSLKQTEVFNGFANRFLWALSKRSKLLPDGGNDISDDYRVRLQSVTATAKNIGQLTRSIDCQKQWASVYEELVSEKHGLWDSVTSRAEAQVLRLSMLFALLDCSATIDVQHLEAALSVWRYCDDSARILFNVEDGSKLRKRLRELIRKTPGIMRSELRNKISHDTKTSVFDAELRWLIQRGEIVCIPVTENGRSSERFYAGIGKPVEVSRYPVSETPTVSAPVPNIPFPVSDTPASSLVELFDWINANAVRFIKRVDGSIWVANDYEPHITPAIAASIQANQETLKSFVIDSAVNPISTGVIDSANESEDEYVHRLTTTPDEELNDLDRFAKELLLA